MHIRASSVGDFSPTDIKIGLNDKAHKTNPTLKPGDIKEITYGNIQVQRQVISKYDDPKVQTNEVEIGHIQSASRYIKQIKLKNNNIICPEEIDTITLEDNQIGSSTLKEQLNNFWSSSKSDKWHSFVDGGMLSVDCSLSAVNLYWSSMDKMEGRWYQVWFCFQRIVSWFFVFLLIAGVTGLMKSSKEITE